MIWLFVFIAVIVLFYVKFERKIKFKWKTFFKKRQLASSDRFGVYCFHGKQGQGKTYCCVKFLRENAGKMEITSNVHLKGIEYNYCNDYNEILKIAEKGNQLILYDEIFSKFNKNSKSDTETINLLSQMRKRGNIMLTTAQDWLELPVWLRRKVKIDIRCKRRNIFAWTFITEQYGDADNMQWSEADNEYISPIIMTSISKMTKENCQAYDTYETIELQK